MNDRQLCLIWGAVLGVGMGYAVCKIGEGKPMFGETPGTGPIGLPADTGPIGELPSGGPVAPPGSPLNAPRPAANPPPPYLTPAAHPPPAMYTPAPNGPFTPAPTKGIGHVPAGAGPAVSGRTEVPPITVNPPGSRPPPWEQGWRDLDGRIRYDNPFTSKEPRYTK